MTKSRIYNLAYAELSRRYEEEEKKNDTISKGRCEAIDAEMNELREMIIQEERKEIKKA